MTPEQLLSNLAALFTALMAPGAVLATIVAVLLYGAGKATDNPMQIRWAKNAGIGAIVLLGGSFAIALVQNVASRVFV